MQKYSSKNTSVNSSKLPAVFSKVCWGNMKQGVNLDFGGGKFDNATEFLKTYDIFNLIYDPYNRDSFHNRKVLDTLAQVKADSATCSNVLNVIAEQEERIKALEMIKSLTTKTATVYITIYEGNKSGKGKVSKKDCWQNNLPLQAYLKEVESVFNSVKIVNQMIVATKI